MKLICTDDTPMHLNMLLSNLRILASKGLDIEVYATGNNGAEAVKLLTEAKSKGIKIDIMTLDIRMPTLDGLSALARIRAMDPSIKVIMASSEDEKTVSKIKTERGNLSNEEKFQLLGKVIQRVVAAKEEPGKINKVLDACEELNLDPILVAKQLKANGYLHKPYTPEQVQEAFAAIAKGATYFAAGNKA